MERQQPQLSAGSMQGGTSTVGPGMDGLNLDGLGDIVHMEEFQQLMAILRLRQSSPEQEQQILQIFKSNPHLMAAFIRERQAYQAEQSAGAGVAGGSPHQQQPDVGHGNFNPVGSVPGQNVPLSQVQPAINHLGTDQGGNLLPMEQWQQRYPGGPGQDLRQPGPQLIQQQQPQFSGMPMQGGTATVRPGMTWANDLANLTHTEEFQQLMAYVRSPKSPEQQHKILQLLKSNPGLMAAFDKYRQERAQAYQGAVGGVAGVSAQQQQPYGNFNLGGGVPGPNMPPSQVQQTINYFGTNQGGNLLPMEQWQQRYPGGAGQDASMQSGTSTGNIRREQLLQQVLAALQSPQSPEQKQQILQRLQCNPRLMGALARQKLLQDEAQRAAVARQQLQQHMLSQQQTPAQHQNQMQAMFGEAPGPAPEPPGSQPITLQQPPALPSYQELLSAIQQLHIDSYNNSFFDQQ